jgi:hypothetical protein
MSKEYVLREYRRMRSAGFTPHSAILHVDVRMLPAVMDPSVPYHVAKQEAESRAERVRELTLTIRDRMLSEGRRGAYWVNGRLS